MPLRHGQTSPAARDLGHQQVRRPALRRLSSRQNAAWCSHHAAWYHYLVETDPVSFEVVPIDKPADMNVIIGQAHFIKTVEDLHEALAGVSPHLQFGLAFCEASSARLVRRSGNDAELTRLAATNALAIGAGHAFVILLREGFPINVMNPLKAVPEVCTVFCATANQVDVLVAVTERGRGIIGVIDGLPPSGIEQEPDVADRHSLLRAIGYKLLRHPSTRQAADALDSCDVGMTHEERRIIQQRIHPRQLLRQPQQLRWQQRLPRQPAIAYGTEHDGLDHF